MKGSGNDELLSVNNGRCDPKNKEVTISEVSTEEDNNKGKAYNANLQCGSFSSGSTVKGNVVTHNFDLSGVGTVEGKINKEDIKVSGTNKAGKVKLDIKFKDKVVNNFKANFNKIKGKVSFSDIVDVNCEKCSGELQSTDGTIVKAKLFGMNKLSMKGLFLNIKETELESVDYSRNQLGSRLVLGGVNKKQSVKMSEFDVEFNSGTGAFAISRDEGDCGSISSSNVAKVSIPGVYDNVKMKRKSGI